MDGVETTKRIRAQGDEEPYYKDLPIIALTANAMSGMREMFLQHGFDDFLSKPIDIVMLDATLEKWIPKEKQTGFVAENFKLNKPKRVDIRIEGLNTNYGVNMSGGKIEVYFETLTMFYEDAAEKKKEIQICPDDRNLPLYITHVHALKSASANIGADKLSETAYALEMAALDGDLSFIENNTEHFFWMLEQIMTNISNAITFYTAGLSNENDSFKPEQLQNELVKLKKALDDMDVNTINRIVDILQPSGLADKSGNTIKKILKHILMAEYDEASALIDSLLA